MSIIDIGNTILAIARDPAWGAIGTIAAIGIALISRCKHTHQPKRALKNFGIVRIDTAIRRGIQAQPILKKISRLDKIVGCGIKTQPILKKIFNYCNVIVHSAY